MSRDRILLIAMPLIVALGAEQAQAQVSYGGSPPSSSVSFLSQAQSVTLQPVDTQALMAEDATRPPGGMYRFGAEIPVDLGTDNAGAWEILPDGSRLWRLRIVSPEALSLNLVFSRFRLPDGAELFLYDESRQFMLGAFNALNNKENGEFATQPVPGSAITLEYMQPSWSGFPGEINVTTVVHAYRNILGDLESRPEGGSSERGSCFVDIACPAGADWETQRRAVVMVIKGNRAGSGFLLNAVTDNGVPLFFTAKHGGNLNNAIFRFRFQRPSCASGSPPRRFTVHGSKRLMASANVDVQMLILKERIPRRFKAFFAGWDRSDSTPSRTTTIGHPRGYPKKIAHDRHAPTKTGVYWRIQEWEVGAIDEVSSGSPLFDTNGRVIGLLKGAIGTPTCGYQYEARFVRLSKFWPEVKAALDPLGTRRTSFHGFDPDQDQGNHPVVGRWKVKGSLTGTASGHSQSGRFRDDFRFYPNFAFEMIDVSGTWVEQANKNVRVDFDTDDMAGWIDLDLPPGFTADVRYFKCKKVRVKANFRKISGKLSGLVIVRGQGQRITIRFRGTMRGKRDLT